MADKRVASHHSRDIEDLGSIIRRIDAEIYADAATLGDRYGKRAGQVLAIAMGVGLGALAGMERLGGLAGMERLMAKEKKR